MQVALHSHYFHIAIIVFVVLDAFIVLFELLLDVGAFGKHFSIVSVISAIKHILVASGPEYKNGVILLSH